MSDFWSFWIIAISLGMIVGTLAILFLTVRKPQPGEQQDQGDVTTGHVWDGNLEEYNNPLPRWWLWMFYITIIYGVLYFILYPGLGSYSGVLGWTAQNQYTTEVVAADVK